MRRISSPFTFVTKRVFPIIWFAALALIVATSVVTSWPDIPPLLSLLVPAVMAVLGYRIMRSTTLDVADEVFDEGDTLLVRNGGREARIPLADIKNVGYAQFQNPMRVTLSLRNPTIFGSQIAFFPPTRMFAPFSSNPVIDELIDRIDAKRRRSGM